MLWGSETGMITVFRLGSGWRLTGGETQTGNLADALSAKPLWYMSKLWQDWDKKARPNLFHSLSSLSFLWLAPVCLSTAEVLAASNQCVHCSVLPPLLSSFFLFPSSLPLSLFQLVSLFLPDRSDIRNLYYQVFPGCWWKSWFATPDWIYLSFIPFQPPTSYPSRQEPNGLSTLRCQRIKISIYRKRVREGGKNSTESRKWREGKNVSPHVTASDSLGKEIQGGYECSPCLFPFQPLPLPFHKPLSTSIIHPFISQQTKHNNKTPPHPESHQLMPHTHPQAVHSKPFKVKLVKSLKGAKTTDNIH